METRGTPPTTIDAYIAAVPVAVQPLLQTLRALIREEAPDALEAIKYQMPTFVLDGTNLVHFGAFTHHIGFYPTPSGIESFQQDLARYKGAKGSVRFPIDEPLPLSLVRRIVRFRVQEVHAQRAQKRRR